MNNDMSWLGLYKRGIKLQYQYGLRWYGVTDINHLTVLLSGEFPIRYKHSIQ